MGKVVGIAEFKANCTRLISEMERDGQSITVTKRGKPVAVMEPARGTESRPKSLFGIMKGSVLRFDDPIEGAGDPEDWEANWEKKWDERGFTVRDDPQR